MNRFSLRTVVPVVAAALASLIAASALAQTGTVADGFREVTARPAAAHNYWTSGAPLPTAVTYQMTGVIAGKIYNVGGHSTKGDNQVLRSGCEYLDHRRVLADANVECRERGSGKYPLHLRRVHLQRDNQ